MNGTTKTKAQVDHDLETGAARRVDRVAPTDPIPAEPGEGRVLAHRERSAPAAAGVGDGGALGETHGLTLPQRIEALAAPPALPPITTEGIAAIASAIAQVTSEIGTVKKTGVNKFHNYVYAKMEDVLAKLTPVVARHGLALIQNQVACGMFEGTNVFVDYDFTIIHKSGAVWPERIRQRGISRARDSKGGFDDKALNKCHTAARKYFLLGLFQIATGDVDDNDGEPNSVEAGTSAPPTESAPLLALDDEQYKQLLAKLQLFKAERGATEERLMSWLQVERLQDIKAIDFKRTMSGLDKLLGTQNHAGNH